MSAAAAAAIRLLLLLSLSPISLSVSESAALLNFKKSLSNTGALDSWTPNTSPCNNTDPWVGVMCNDGVLSGLHLPQMDLSGKIDVDALLEIPTLRTITLVNNSFSGPIPEFNRIGMLKALYLSFNDFSGEIPSNYFSKTLSLKKIELSGNKFTGEIPGSLGQIPHLMELRLEKNAFSGAIPVLAQKSLTSIDLSNNKLEGEIPESMSRFNRRAFEGNPELCGTPVGKSCYHIPAANNGSTSPATMQEQISKPGGKSVKGWVVIGVFVTLLALAVLIRTRKSKEQQFDKLGKENLDEVIEVRVHSSNRRSVHSNVSQRSRSSTRKGSQRGMGDLVMVNEDMGFFGMADLMKAEAEVLGSGGLGSTYKAMMANGVAVVVKRVREMNKMSKDSFDSEMRRLGGLRHRNVLKPLAYHFRKDEKLLVSEHVSKGSLLYVLHADRGISHAGLNWPSRLKIIKGVARAMGFLHAEFSSYELPHGNLKSSNILLDSTYEPVLSDYALYPLINTTQAAQAMFAFKSPEAILYQQVTPKSDVFCLGIVILEILMGKFPSQYLNNQKGGTDVVQWARSAISEKRERELIDPDIAGATNSGSDMERLLHIGVACTESNIDQRMDMNEAIRRIEEIQD